jgi:cell division protein FtsZ
LLESFQVVDDVLRQGIQGIAELITVPGLINVDFADVKAIMKDQGTALMGIGRATGDNRAVEAAKAAIDSPLLEMPIDGAKGILFTVTGGENMSMYEVNEAARVITQSADANAKIIFGAVIDEALKDELKITVIATGFGKSGGGRPAKKVMAAGTMTMGSTDLPTISERSKPIMPTPAASRPVAPPAPKAPEDDLEIPAFIRKKML